MHLTRVCVEQQVAVLHMINEPVNALSKSLRNEIVKQLNGLEQDQNVRAVVLTSSLRVFAAGADINELSDILGHPDLLSHFVDDIQGFIREVERFPKPLIAAMGGHALGGGMELALCCDLRIGLAGAKYGFPEVGLGLIPAGGGNSKLAFLIGQARAAEMILTGGSIDGQTATAYGLFNGFEDSMDDVLNKAKALAVKAANNGPLALRNAKQILRKSQMQGMEHGILEERGAFLELLQSQDALEGLQAFQQKRVANYKGV